MTLGLVQADTSNEGKCIRNLLFCVKEFSCGGVPPLFVSEILWIQIIFS